MEGKETKALEGLSSCQGCDSSQRGAPETLGVLLGGWGVTVTIPHPPIWGMALDPLCQKLYYLLHHHFRLFPLKASLCGSHNPHCPNSRQERGSLRSAAPGAPRHPQLLTAFRLVLLGTGKPTPPCLQHPGKSAGLTHHGCAQPAHVLWRLDVELWLEVWGIGGFVGRAQTRESTQDSGDKALVPQQLHACCRLLHDVLTKLLDGAS